MKSVENKRFNLPKKPGVYIYKNTGGKVIYVGKAKNLYKRVNSYFTKKHQDGKTRILVRKIADIEYILVATEMDALLLENNLIKKYQPRYNIMLKDDKTYPWICIKNERFPRIFSTRNKVNDGSQYFGPYASVKMMNTLLDLIRQLYPLRTCNYDLSEAKIEEGKYKVCLEYHIGNCLGPCVGKQAEEDYDNNIVQARDLIKGNIKSVIRKLNSVMRSSAENYEFEKAQLLKEKIEILEKYKSKSTVVSPTIGNVEVMTVVSDEKSAFVNYFLVMDGAIVQGTTTEVKKQLNESYDDILQHTLVEMRDRYKGEAKETIVEYIPDDQFGDFNFFVPQRGDKKKLLELSLRNAKYMFKEREKQKKKLADRSPNVRVLEQLQNDLKLKTLPRHIECFDNSNFQGTNPVAACVVFKNGQPSKKDYRHFNIKTVSGPDDFASMEEVVYRRYKRLLEEEQSLPELIVIDGGKGQLSAAVKSLEKLDLRGKIAIIGIAKKLEEIFFPGDQYPIHLSKRSSSLKLIQYLRNEAHRFGITHHRGKRSKGAIQSSLESIPGIGTKTIQMLLSEYKSIERIKKLSVDELSEHIGVSKARKIVSHFKDLPT